MRSKKAQGELITTVLIILVIIAAVAIVAGVIFTLLNKGKSTIDASSQCWGVSLEVVSATPEIGTCTYPGAATCVMNNIPRGSGNLIANCPTTGLPSGCTNTQASSWLKTGELGTCTYSPSPATATCTQPPQFNILSGPTGSLNSNCPIVSNCASSWARTSSATGSDAVVTVKRNAGATGTLVSPVLLINGSIITAVPNRNNLSELDQATFTGVVLARGDSVQVGARLFPSGVACNTILSGTIQAG